MSAGSQSEELGLQGMSIKLSAVVYEGRARCSVG